MFDEDILMRYRETLQEEVAKYGMVYEFSEQGKIINLKDIIPKELPTFTGMIEWIHSMNESKQ